MAVRPVPEGFHTLTPHLVVSDAAQAIEFYKNAFGGKEVMRMPGPGGKVMHAEVQLGDSILMLNDEFPEMGGRSPMTLGGSPVTLMMYVPNVDQVFAQAVAAGATSIMPVADQFWGDRYGMVKDPFGHQWAIATHKEDLSPAQIAERHAAAFAAGK
jgi:uncharacterized glyoxalase superfamily protein PhnB